MDEPANEGRFYVAWNLNPVRFAGCGVTWVEGEECPLPTLGAGPPDGWKWISHEEWNHLADSSEPSKVIAEWLGLPFQKYLDGVVNPVPNVVELVSDGECAWDQPCRFGHRVEDYAVYCHNARWIDSPRKCHRRQKASAWQKAWPHEECPGYEPNPAKRPSWFARLKSFFASEGPTR